jgi:hypothetical protein
MQFDEIQSLALEEVASTLMELDPVSSVGDEKVD